MPNDSAALRDTRGFTLVEVMVSVGVFAVMALGLAQLLGFAVHTVHASRTTTASSLLAAQKLEQLRALTWAIQADGTRLSDTATDISREPATQSGAGLQPTGPSNLTQSVDGYVDYLDPNGLWIGAGPSVPRGAAYVRRWAVLAPSDDPDDTRVLVVRAGPVGTLQNPAGARSTRWPEEAVLAAIKTRPVVP